MSKWVDENFKLKKCDWSEVYERLSCASDLLGHFHQDARLSPLFKEEISKIQENLDEFADKFWKKSRTKKELKEMGYK